MIERNLADPSAEVRRCSLETLGLLDATVIAVSATIIVHLLGDEDVDVHWSALERFRQLDPTLREEHVEAIMPRLLDANADVRWCACEALCELRPAALLEEHVLALVKMLDDTSSDVRRAAFDVLRKQDSEVLVPHQGIIGHLMCDADAELRKRTIKTWCHLQQVRSPSKRRGSKLWEIAKSRVPTKVNAES